MTLFLGGFDPYLDDHGLHSAPPHSDTADAERAYSQRVGDIFASSSLANALTRGDRAMAQAIVRDHPTVSINLNGQEVSGAAALAAFDNQQATTAAHETDHITQATASLARNYAGVEPGSGLPLTDQPAIISVTDSPLPASGSASVQSSGPPRAGAEGDAWGYWNQRGEFVGRVDGVYHPELNATWREASRIWEFHEQNNADRPVIDIARADDWTRKPLRADSDGVGPEVLMATTMVLSRGGLNPLLAVAGGAGLLTGWLMGPMLREMGRVRVDVGPPPVPLKAEETTDQPQAPPAVGERPSNPPVSLPTDQELPKGELVPRPKDAAPPATETTDAPPVEETDDGPTTGEGSRPDVGQEPTSGPSQPPKDITGPIIGTATEQLGERLVDVLRSEGSIAPNGVPRIVKREWSPDEYKAWFDSLPNQPAKTNTSADIYQIIHAGDTVYTISGGGVEFDADGIRDRTVLEVKFIGDPERSPYVEGSKFPDFIRYRDGGPDAKTRGEFERMGKILRDNNNPLTSVRLITSDPRAVPYFERLMREYNVPGEIIVDTRTDIVDDDQR